MLKFKAKIKNSELTVKAKISSDEVISDREIEIFENKNIRGFLRSLNGFDIPAIEDYISKEDKDIPKQIKKQKITESGFIK